MHCATHTLLVSCSRFNYGFGVSFAISSRVPSHSWAQLSQGLSTKSPLPSSPSSMSSAPFVCSIQFVLSVSPSFRVRPSRVVALLLPFDRCRRRRVVSSLSRPLFHFLVTFVWPLETLRGSAPSVCARARCPRPSSRRLSVRSTVAACNHPPCVAHAFVSMLSCLQFMLTPPSPLLSRWPLARPPSPNCISFR